MSVRMSAAAALLVATQAGAEPAQDNQLQGAFPDREVTNNGVLEAADYGQRDAFAQAVLENYIAGPTQESFFRINSIHFNHDINEACYEVMVFDSPLREVFEREHDVIANGVACLPFGIADDAIPDVGMYRAQVLEPVNE